MAVDSYRFPTWWTTQFCAYVTHLTFRLCQVTPAKSSLSSVNVWLAGTQQCAYPCHSTSRCINKCMYYLSLLVSCIEKEKNGCQHWQEDSWQTSMKIILQNFMKITWKLLAFMYAQTHGHGQHIISLPDVIIIITIPFIFTNGKTSRITSQMFLTS